MTPTYNEDKGRWFYGSESIQGQIQGLFYVPSLKRFVGEDGTVYPLTFEQPKELVTPSDMPSFIATLTPYDFPTPETVETIKAVVENGLPGLTVEYHEDRRGRDYIDITNPIAGASERFSVGRLARSLMVFGAATMFVSLKSELKTAGIL